MAGIVRRLGRTRIGYWLWRRSRAGPGRPLADTVTGALSAAERALLRRWPPNRRHDRAQAARLAAFEAETRARQDGGPEDGAGR